MSELKYTIEEVIQTLENRNLGWSYKDDKAFFFNGKPVKVINSNCDIPDSEVLGKIIGNKFISDGNDYEATIEQELLEVKAVALKCTNGVVIIPKGLLKIRNAEGKIIEGYWYSNIATQFPMPIPNVLTKQEAIKIYELIKAKETECDLHSFRGSSMSRIDGTTVGDKEFAHKEWVWPEGFAEHYVLKYRVKPTAAFLKFIGWK